MPMVGWNPSDGARRMAAAAARPPRGFLWRISCSTMALAAVAGLALALGFLWFVWRLPAEEITLNRDADGIVVLTGGASRITGSTIARGSSWRSGCRPNRGFSRYSWPTARRGRSTPSEFRIRIWC